MSEAVQEIIVCVMSCMELALACIWAISYTKVRRKNDELEATVLLLTERLKIAGDLLERESKWREIDASEGVKPGFKLTRREEDEEPNEEIKARRITINGLEMEGKTYVRLKKDHWEECK